MRFTGRSRVPWLWAVPEHGASAVFGANIPGRGPTLLLDLGSVKVEIPVPDDPRERADLDEFLKTLAFATTRLREWLELTGGPAAGPVIEFDRTGGHRGCDQLDHSGTDSGAARLAGGRPAADRRRGRAGVVVMRRLRSWARRHIGRFCGRRGCRAWVRAPRWLCEDCRATVPRLGIAPGAFRNCRPG